MVQNVTVGGDDLGLYSRGDPQLLIMVVLSQADDDDWFECWQILQVAS